VVSSGGCFFDRPYVQEGLLLLFLDLLSPFILTTGGLPSPGFSFWPCRRCGSSFFLAARGGLGCFAWAWFRSRIFLPDRSRLLCLRSRCPRLLFCGIAVVCVTLAKAASLPSSAKGSGFPLSSPFFSARAPRAPHFDARGLVLKL